MLGLSFLWALIGGARGIFVAAGVAVAVFVSLQAYDRLVDDPAVAAAARRDFVARAELTAARAQLAELQRQVTAGNRAIEQFQKMAEADELADAEMARRQEQEIAGYEQALADAGRSCKITPQDLDFLRR